MSEDIENNLYNNNLTFGLKKKKKTDLINRKLELFLENISRIDRFTNKKYYYGNRTIMIKTI